MDKMDKTYQKYFFKPIFSEKLFVNKYYFTITDTHVLNLADFMD